MRSTNSVRLHPLSKKITLFMGSILITNIMTAAHKCYICGPNSPDDSNKVPSCINFTPNDPKFIKECEPRAKGCRIETNGTTTVRSCEMFAIQDCKKANNIEYCFCTTDLCNKELSTHVDEEKEESDGEDTENEGSGYRNNVPIIDDITSVLDTTTKTVKPTQPVHKIKSTNTSSTFNVNIMNQYYMLLIFLTTTIFRPIFI